MKESYRCVAARLIVIALVLALTAWSTPQRGLLAAAAEPITVAPDGSRLWVTTPYLWLEFDLRHPSMDELVTRSMFFKLTSNSFGISFG